MRELKRHTISTVVNKNGKTSFRIYLGLFDGKRRYKQFIDFKKAESFCVKLNRDLELKKIGYDKQFGRMLDQKNEILFCLEKIEELDVSLTEVVQFYEKFGECSKGDISIEDSIKLFRKEKEKTGKSKIYLDKSIHSYLSPFSIHVRRETLVSEINEKMIEDYVYKTRKNVSPRTKVNLINQLSILFNFLIKKGHLKFNPTKNIERPKVLKKKPTIIKVGDLRKLLDGGLKEEKFEEVTILVLQCFCGVRSYESGRMVWGDIDWNRKVVQVRSEVSKMSSHRICEIPPNCFEFLQIVRENLFIRVKDKDRRIIKNFEHRMRKFRGGLGIDLPTNILRHSFGSYHFSRWGDSNKTRNQMGHHEGEFTFLNHYRDLVHEDMSVKYFDIYPFNTTEKTFRYDPKRHIVTGPRVQ